MTARTTALLVRLSPDERTELERVRREMGARSMADAVRRVVELWDERRNIIADLRRQEAERDRRHAEKSRKPWSEPHLDDGDVANILNNIVVDIESGAHKTTKARREPGEGGA